MSNPSPEYDPENVREDDDLRRVEEDARRYEEEHPLVTGDLETQRFIHDSWYLDQCRRLKKWNETWTNWAKGE